MLIICFLMYAGVSSFDAKTGQPNHPSSFFTVFFLYVKSGGGFQTFLRLEEWQLAWWLSGSGVWAEDREREGEKKPHSMPKINGGGG